MAKEKKEKGKEKAAAEPDAVPRLANHPRAKTQIGVREATGNNDGVPSERYSNGQKEPWCANFVSWCFRESGNPLPGNQDAIGSCDTMARELG